MNDEDQDWGDDVNLDNLLYDVSAQAEAQLSVVNGQVTPPPPPQPLPRVVFRYEDESDGSNVSSEDWEEEYLDEEDTWELGEIEESFSNNSSEDEGSDIILLEDFSDTSADSDSEVMSQEVEGDRDGGYDDDTDADAAEDDEVVIIESNSEEENQAANVNEDNEDVDTDNDDDDPANGGPPRKVAKMDNQEPAANKKENADDGESDGQSCTICYDQFTNSGEHRISCLKCGHVFGKNCIEKWLRIHGRCPQCNCKAVRKDVRILYVKSLQAVDNTELTEARRELETAKITISKYTLESAKFKINVETLNRQLRALENENLESKRLIASLQARRFGTPCNPGPSYSSSTAAVPSLSGSVLIESENSIQKSTIPAGRKQLKFTFAKCIPIKEGVCRVGAYNENLHLMVVSHDMKNSLFPNGCCGIKQFNMLDLRPTLSFQIHQKQIRDMQFSSSQTDVLLTVALDKKAILYNCNGNVNIQTFNTDYPLWSCAWDDVNPHIFYVGCCNGQIIAYDIRNPQEPLTTYAQGPDTSPICRIKYVRPAYQSNSFNLSGLIVQQLNSITFRENRGSNSEMRLHPLPLEGPFVSADFEPVSRHMLASTRPRAESTQNHFVCDLTQQYDDTVDSNVVSCNLLHSYQGSNLQKMGRSSIHRPGDGHVFVLANGMQNTVKYWDISLPEQNQQSISYAPEYVLDFVHGRVNSTQFLSLVSETGVRIFSKSF